jgi:hypothetical protein
MGSIGDGVGFSVTAIRLREKRSEMMILSLEDVALRLFEQQGFAEVTVDDIAAEAPPRVLQHSCVGRSKRALEQPQLDHSTDSGHEH